MNACAPTLTKGPESTTDINAASSRKDVVPDVTDIFTDSATQIVYSMPRASDEENPIEFPNIRKRLRPRRHRYRLGGPMCELTVMFTALQQTKLTTDLNPLRLSGLLGLTCS